jgi:hypothetical protein
MSECRETQKAVATDANTGATGKNLDKEIVKAFFVGICNAGAMVIFAEAATTPTTSNDNNDTDDMDGEHSTSINLPNMNDSPEGLRFVDCCGQEYAHFTPTMTFICDGAMTEVKKYLYGVDVA